MKKIIIICFIVLNSFYSVGQNNYYSFCNDSIFLNLDYCQENENCMFSDSIKLFLEPYLFNLLEEKEYIVARFYFKIAIINKNIICYGLSSNMNFTGDELLPLVITIDSMSLKTSCYCRFIVPVSIWQRSE